MAEYQPEIMRKEASCQMRRSGSRPIPFTEFSRYSKAVVKITRLHEHKQRMHYASGSIIKLPEFYCQNKEIRVYLLTCHHFIKDREMAKISQIHFQSAESQSNSSEVKNGSDIFHLSKESFSFFTDNKLDCTLISINEEELQTLKEPIEPLEILHPCTDAFPDDTAYILHHPNLPPQVKGTADHKQESRILSSSSLQCHNSSKILEVEYPVLAHMLDTSEGSSGSPLLKESDHKLQLLGLHIGTYPATQPLFNVGIHIKKILDHFKSNKVSQLDVDLINELICQKHFNKEEMNDVHVKVDGIPSFWTKSHLNMVFDCDEGGDIKRVVLVDDRKGSSKSHSALIVFRRDQVAREICKKSEWVASSISGEDDVVLQLTLIEAPIDLEAQTIRDKDDYSPKTTLLLCNIPVNTNEDHLRCYIGWVTNLNSGEFEFSIRNQKAVLVVPRGKLEDVYDAFQKTDKEICGGKQLMVKRLQKADTIIIKNLPSEMNNQSQLTFIGQYFGNKKKSGGGSVKMVEPMESGDILVSFKSEFASACVENVMSRDHSLFGEDVKLHRYYSVLSEWLLTSEDSCFRTVPKFEIIKKSKLSTMSAEIQIYFDDKFQANNTVGTTTACKTQRDFEVVFRPIKSEESPCKYVVTAQLSSQKMKKLSKQALEKYFKDCVAEIMETVKKLHSSSTFVSLALLTNGSWLNLLPQKIAPSVIASTLCDAIVSDLQQTCMIHRVFIMDHSKEIYDELLKLQYINLVHGHNLHVIGLHVGSYPQKQPLFNVGICTSAIISHFHGKQDSTVDIVNVLKSIKQKYDDTKETNEVYVQVEGIPSTWTKESLFLIFDCDRGGEIKQIILDKENGSHDTTQRAFILFRNDEVARSVCQQDKWMTKTRNGGSVELKLTLFHMPVSRHLKSCQLREAGYSSETTLLITGIPGMVNYDHLLFYIQCVGKLQLSEFQLTKPNSKGEAVLVLAKEKVEETFKNLNDPAQPIVSENKECITVTKLPQADSVIIKRMSPEKKRQLDAVWFYFNNKKRSGGNTVKSINTVGFGHVVVTFDTSDLHGVENVVSRDHTAFLGEEVEVSRYYPLLEGWLNVPYIPPIEIVSSLEDLKGVKPDICFGYSSPIVTSEQQKGNDGYKTNISLRVDDAKNCRMLLTVHISKSKMKKLLPNQSDIFQLYLEECLKEAMATCEELQFPIISLPVDNLALSNGKWSISRTAQVVTKVITSALRTTLWIKKCVIVAEDREMYKILNDLLF